MSDISYPEIALLIGSEQRRKRETIAVVNPADETVVGSVPVAETADLDHALEAAERGLAVWRRTSPADRAKVMLRAAALLRERVDLIAGAITLEQGKPLSQARGEVGRAADIIEWDANEGRRLYGQIVPSEQGMTYSTLHQPIGIVAAFTPWNFPIASPSRKIGGALAAGCSIVLKPSEETPAGAWFLAQAFHDAGAPDGLINLVYGDPAQISDHLVRQPSVRMVTLTGSVPVGKQVAALAGQYMKPTIMELGGHAPVIICDDADPENAAEQAAISKSLNAGQVCVAPTRFFVAESIFERFTTALAGHAAKLRVGDGRDPATQMGPLANQRRLDAVDSLVSDAVRSGARRHTGSKLSNKGYFHSLSVLSEISDDARIMREEPFGPVALVNPVRSLEDAIMQANRLPFGLSAYAFTKSARNARILSDEVESGTLGINHFNASVPETPFGGVKDSGYGREGGSDGVRAFTVVKSVAHLAL